MSRPSQPSGTASVGTTFASASASNAAAATTSVGSLTGTSIGLGADLLGHLAADEDDVGPLGEAAEHADLVLDLGAADDRDERPRRLVEQLAELLELALEQQPRVRRQQVRDALGRRVRAVAEPNASLT